MDDFELIFTMLSEKVTTEISQQEKPDTFPKNKKVAKRGGGVAGMARKETEKEIGRAWFPKKIICKSRKTENGLNQKVNMETREILQEIISDFSPDKFVRFFQTKAINLHRGKKELLNTMTRISKTEKGWGRLHLLKPSSWRFLLFKPVSRFQSEAARKPSTKQAKRFSRIGNTTPVFSFFMMITAISASA